MIVVMKSDATAEQVEHMVAHIKALGMSPQVLVGTQRTVIAAIDRLRLPQHEDPIDRKASSDPEASTTGAGVQGGRVRAPSVSAEGDQTAEQLRRALQQARDAGDDAHSASVAVQLGYVDLEQGQYALALVPY